MGRYSLTGLLCLERETFFVEGLTRCPAYKKHLNVIFAVWFSRKLVLKFDYVIVMNSDLIFRQTQTPTPPPASPRCLPCPPSPLRCGQPTGLPTLRSTPPIPNPLPTALPAPPTPPSASPSPALSRRLRGPSRTTRQRPRGWGKGVCVGGGCLSPPLVSRPQATEEGVASPSGRPAPRDSHSPAGAGARNSALAEPGARGPWGRGRP